jgi:hypothetical protein
MSLVNRFSHRYANPDAPVNGTGEGIVLTSGLADTQGTAVELAADTVITGDVYGIEVRITRGLVAAQDTSQLLELLVDPAGGTSYQTWIPEFPCGNSGRLIDGGGLWYWFPRFASAGSTIAGRIRGTVASSTCEVYVKPVMSPTRPEKAFKGTYAERIGTITGSRGVAVGTVGTSGAEGTWVLLGATVSPLDWLGLCPNINDTNTQSAITYFDLAFGDATNKVIVAQNIPILGGTSESVCKWLTADDFGFAAIPASTNIYARASITSASADTYNAVAIGIKGSL